MPVGLTLLLKVPGGVPRVPLDGDRTERLLVELVSRAGVSKEAFRRKPPPFSIASLMPAEGDRSSGDGGARESRRFRLRLGWLADEDLERLLERAGSLRVDPVRVEGVDGPWIVEDAIVSTALTQRWNRRAPYFRLYEEASDCLRLVTLKFYSVTTLERRGLPYPLPDPSGVFRGYSRIWDRYSGIALAPGLPEAIEQQLLLVDFRIQRRRAVTPERDSVAGFVGSATFRLEGRHPESILKGLNVLADYAFFCGTGVGTHRGMGLTRRIPERENRT